MTIYSNKEILKEYGIDENTLMNQYHIASAEHLNEAKKRAGWANATVDEAESLDSMKLYRDEMGNWYATVYVKPNFGEGDAGWADGDEWVSLGTLSYIL